MDQVVKARMAPQGSNRALLTKFQPYHLPVSHAVDVCVFHDVLPVSLLVLQAVEQCCCGVCVPVEKDQSLLTVALARVLNDCTSIF
jgi:hypothetical protein